MPTLRTAELNLLRLAGFQSIRAGMQAVMHDITTLLAMARRLPTSRLTQDFESVLDNYLSSNRVQPRIRVFRPGVLHHLNGRGQRRQPGAEVAPAARWAADSLRCRVADELLHEGITTMNIGRRIYQKWLSAMMALSPTSWIDKFSDELLRLRLITQEVLRQRQARKDSRVIPALLSCTGQPLVRSVMEVNAPWENVYIARCNIPGMLTDSERRYYGYITGFYSGLGDVVELGPWLGLSTHYIISSLLKNPHFATRKLHVIDDFTWRASWMNKWLVGTSIPALDNHASFQHLFESQLSDLLDNLIVTRQKICDYDGNEALPLLEWKGGPIELLIVDCGRTLAVNEAWWQVFASSFIPNRTLIVMQDWQNHKRVPEIFWENTKIFTDSKEQQLELVHEVKNAGIATFLYRDVKRD